MGRKHSNNRDKHAREGTHQHDLSHGSIDPSILTSKKGIRAVKWSFLVLFVTAVFQIIVVILSGSVALLSDTIHNFSDAATAIPLGIAFLFALRKPTRKFTYGFGRVEDMAGVAIVLTILLSAIAAGYESIHRLFHPQRIDHIGAIILASIVGFLGNEVVAFFRIRTGKEIRSAALIADGYHARADGFTSLAVFFGAIGVWLGYSLADPIIGLCITVAILRITWNSVKTVFLRLLDGVESEVIDEIEHAVHHVAGVKEVSDMRVRWIGHRLHVEMSITVEPQLSVVEGHAIAKEVNHELCHHMSYLSKAVIHVDPLGEAGEKYHTER